MATNESPVEGSPEEENAETEQQETDEQTKQKGLIKVPEAFQQECAELVNGVKTIPELNFLMDLVNEQRSALEKSQKKSKLTADEFSTEDMPQS